MELVIANTREIKSMAKRLCGITKCVLIFLSTKDRRPFQLSRAKHLRLDAQTWLKRAHMRHLHCSIAVLKTSPSGKPIISFAGTRLSEQPIHKYFGCCCDTNPLKKLWVIDLHVGGPLLIVAQKRVKFGHILNGSRTEI